MRGDEDAPPIGGRWVFTGAAVAFVAGAACYVNALSGKFVFDDIKLIVNNEALRSTATIRQLFFTDLWGAAGFDTGYYRPFAAVVFRLLYAAFGRGPESFHVVSVLLHAATTALVFLLVRAVLFEDHRDGVRAREAPALAAALLFAVHPVHVEAVAWISGMMDVASTFFAVLFLVLHIRGARAISWLALFAGLLFKESAIAAAPIAALFDLSFRREPERPVRAWLRSWSGIAAAIAGYLILRYAALGYLGAPPGLASGAASRTVTGALVLVGSYVQKLIVPHPLNAVPDVRVPVSILTFAALRLGLALAALAALAVVAARRNRVPLFALALFAVPLLPALFVAPMDPKLELAFAERYLYFPSVGFCLFLAYGLSTLAAVGKPRLHLASTVALAVVIALFAVLTVGRNRVWHDALSLWSDTARKTPGLSRVRSSLGLAFYRQGRPELARAEFAEALRLQPELPQEYVRTGVLAAQRGQLLMGMLDLQTALLLDPSNVDAHFNLAVAYENQGWAEMAMASYARVLELQPGHAAARQNLERAYALAGRAP